MAGTNITAVEGNSLQFEWTPAELCQLESNSMDEEVFARRMLLEGIRARLMVALCVREDMESVIADAR